MAYRPTVYKLGKNIRKAEREREGFPFIGLDHAITYYRLLLYCLTKLLNTLLSKNNNNKYKPWQSLNTEATGFANAERTKRTRRNDIQ